MVKVCTLLAPAERARLDAAGSGCFTALHAATVGELRAAARHARVDAVVISAAHCAQDALPAVARFVREFPAIPTVALVLRHDGATTEALLRLGATGVRLAVDATEPGGWRRLRDTVGRPVAPVTARILARLDPALDGSAVEVVRFFETLARLAPALATVRSLCRHLGVQPSTLMSRFQRAGLPSPKSYLAGMRLLHVAYLLGNPGLSVADVAYRMDFSSPQSLGRHLKAMLGLTPGEFRQRFPFEVALSRYLDLLIIPYREILRALHPCQAGLRDQGPDVPAVSRAG